ncbi:major coat protein [Vibrio phage XacF13]|uniref:Major coat protein n=1 Tax=Vibrio phage XacF13 TaxID=3071318 RepID=A0A5P8FRS5_9VIRU|nr:major coat protein [Vibrio phage XacF13]QFQ33300.1 major coat protein [Vibrio phage XacF13]
MQCASSRPCSRTRPLLWPQLVRPLSSPLRPSPLAVVVWMWVTWCRPSRAQQARLQPSAVQC